MRFSCLGGLLRAELERLLEALECAGEDDFACLVSDAVNGSDEELREFLVSDTLWGGAGSIADQAGLRSVRDDSRRDIESALIDMGDAQVASGLTNVRTASWTDVFRKWRQRGTQLASQPHGAAR